MTAVVQITMNNLMTIYGAQSVYGSDTALSAYGMMMKVYQIAHSMFVGVSSATQPLSLIHIYSFGIQILWYGCDRSPNPDPRIPLLRFH